MSEEQTAPSACPHPEAIGKRWGDPISEERQAKLMDVLDDRERTERELDMILSPLAFEHLSGADLFWLSKHARIPISRDTNELHLEQANLHGSHLEGAQLAEVYLQSADLKGAHLEKADLHLAHLEGAHLTGAHLESAFLYYTFLMRADLSDAHLEQSDLREAHLEVANLDGANLEGAILSNAHLGGANFQGTIFDGATMLNEVILVDTRYGAFRVADARWGDVNLAVVSDWSPFTERGIPVGDERMAAEWKRVNFTETEKERQRPREIRARERRRHDAQQVKTQRNLFLAAVRANRQLAIALRAQGMNEQADYFAYRAQVVQRAVLRQQRKWGRALGSWLLDLISGYGYKPTRSLIAYILIICVFAGAYFLNAQFAAPHLSWDEALVLSITSFHGRGFFTSGISLGDTLARLAAGEAIIGLLIEITFIATFTQRYFAR